MDGQKGYGGWSSLLSLENSGRDRKERKRRGKAEECLVTEEKADLGRRWVMSVVIIHAVLSTNI